MKYEPITYDELDSKQKEAYNFQKVSAVFADIGFITIRMSSDWSGVDFIAQHKDENFLKAQLKSRLTFSAKYKSKDIYICFGDRERGRWYLYPHDLLLEQNIQRGYIGEEFWSSHQEYSNPKPSKGQEELLEPYLLRPDQALSL